MTDTITKTAFFDASRELVWKFLTESDKLAKWFHPSEENLAEGADYKLIRRADDGAAVPQIWGKVLKADPPSLLRTTFIIGPFNGAETTVTWNLEEVAGGTRLTMVHEGVASAAGDATMGLLMALDHGWEEHLGQLRTALKP